MIQLGSKYDPNMPSEFLILPVAFYEGVSVMAFSTCFMSPLFCVFQISMPMIFPFSSSSRCTSGSASITSWLSLFKEKVQYVHCFIVPRFHFK